MSLHTFIGILIFSISSIYWLQSSKETRLIGRTPEPLKNFNVARASQSFRALAFFTLIFLPFSCINIITTPEYALYTTVFVVLFYLFPVVFSVESQPCLIIIPTLTGNKAHVHLADDGAIFTKEHYRALFVITEKLKEKGVENICLSSPLFFKSGSARELTNLRRVCRRRFIGVEERTLGLFDVLLPKLKLAWKKHISKSPALQQLDLTKWKQITLYFNN